MSVVAHELPDKWSAAHKEHKPFVHAKTEVVVKANNPPPLARSKSNDPVASKHASNESLAAASPRRGSIESKAFVGAPEADPSKSLKEDSLRASSQQLSRDSASSR